MKKVKDGNNEWFNEGMNGNGRNKLMCKGC